MWFGQASMSGGAMGGTFCECALPKRRMREDHWQSPDFWALKVQLKHLPAAL